MAGKRKKKKKQGKVLLSLVTIVILALLCIVGNQLGLTSGIFGNSTLDDTTSGMDTTPASPVISGGSLAMHVIDVGQGDCILLTCDGGNVLIDSGINNTATKAKMVEYIKGVGVSTIDYFVLTHPDADHIGGAPEIFENFAVLNVIMPDRAATTKIYSNTLTAIENEGCPVFEATPGDVYTLGDLTMKIIAPNKTYSTNNDSSVVIHAVYGSTSIMLTGDAEIESENDILNNFGTADLASTIIKIGHHGSSSSTSEAFITAVAPQYAVISCGVDNSYGHPHKETIATLERHGITYYRTDLVGTIVFVSDGTTFTYVSDQ